MKEKLKYLQYPKLKEEIEKMGYELGRGTLLKACAILLIAAGVLSYLYFLKIPFILTLMGIGLLSVPSYVYHDFKNKYEKKKYLDLTVYMEQMLYSFKRHPKILDALQDTKQVFTEGSMQDVIVQAIARIQDGTGEELYKNSLKIIENEYGCRRLSMLHNFLIQVEERGGEYKQTADLMLDDRERWKTNVELQDAEKKGRKKAINIVLVGILGICLVLVKMFSSLKGIQVVDYSLYQISTTIFLLFSGGIWLTASNRLGESWEFGEKDLDEEKLEKEYELIQTFDLKAAERKARRYACIPALALVVGFILKSIPIIVVGAYFIFFFLTSPKGRLRSAKKKVIREIKKIFPQWLMELTLLLQVENVYVSLSRSMENAPKIMKGEIELLLKGLDQDPNSMEPFHNFFNILHIEDVNTCMKILYSISAFDAHSENSPLTGLVERNNVMMNKAEKMISEDKLSIWTSIAYLPMAIGGIKIILDMVLLIASLLGSITSMA